MTNIKRLVQAVTSKSVGMFSPKSAPPVVAAFAGVLTGIGVGAATAGIISSVVVYGAIETIGSVPCSYRAFGLDEKEVGI
jgi:hypothetical protein